VVDTDDLLGWANGQTNKNYQLTSD
jgi:hypothetical protein